MKVLAGYPLALEVVLPNLKSQSPSQILDALQAADFDLDSGSEDKTKSILKCVEYSHSNLSPDAQRLLICLAPFTGFIYRDGISKYAEQLQKLEPFQDYDFANFDAAIQEAINWGLLEGRNEANRMLTIQPIFPYFLKTKLASLDEATRKALQEGFKNHYQGLAGFYNQLMQSKAPQERQLGIFFCRLEYENLYNAMQTCLANQESIDIFFCLAEYFKLIEDIQSRLKLSKFVYEAQESYPPESRTGGISLQIVMVLERLAYCYWKTKAYQNARQAYQRIISLYESLSDIEERERQLCIANIYQQLGNVAQNSREYGEARQNYQQALSINIEFGDRQAQADNYTNLGIIAQDLREYDESRQNCQKALAIYIEYGDHYAQANTYHQLGRVALELRKYAEARQNYKQALAIKRQYGDRYGQAITYQDLGSVALELGEYAEARHNYQQSLAIKIEHGDLYYQAITYHCLGIVAQKLREYGEARQNYQQALAIKRECGDRYGQARTYQQLGILAAAEGNLTEAGQNLLQALEIFAQFQDRRNVEIGLNALSIIYKTTQDANLLESISQVLGISVDQARQQLESS
jgi:tetratricopeptide (TPR) repeat protein